jgi:hypothetical protein
MKFSITRKDPRLLALMETAEHKILGIWTKECAERAIHFFEADHPYDPRPREALETLEAWIVTGEFSMQVIRKASLSSHAAAREVGADNPARSAARAAGQAVATAHVAGHSIAAANYAAQAIYRSSQPELVAAEQDWQYHRLAKLIAAES